MAELRIRVTAYSDRSLSVAHRPLIDSAQRATTAVNKEGQKAGESFARNVKKGTDAADREQGKWVKQSERWYKQWLNAEERALNQSLREHERAEREKTRIAKREAAERERELQRQARNAERANRQFNSSVGRGVTRGVGVAGRAAAGILRSAAGGAGLDLDMSKHMANAVSLEKETTDLSNAGFMPGKGGPNGARQDPAKIAEEIRKVQRETATTSGEAVGGLRAFVGKTGDLQTGRDALYDMSKLSKATGASLEDMMDAAGDVANALGETDNKGEKVKAVMGAIAAQGKEGAVEIKDLARQMAKLGAASGSFTGDHSRVMAEMGALAQMSRAKGGSASATQAATSVLSFTNTFDKSAREKAFKSFGVQTRDSGGKLRDPIEIIKDSIKAASSSQHGGMGAFSQNMGQMFMDARARSTTRGFETIYKDAGGGAAGLDAVQKAFDDLANSVMNQTEVNDSFNAAMTTTDAKSKVMNAQFEALATQLKTGLLPAAEMLVPMFISLATKGVDLLGELTGLTEKKRRHDEVGTENQAINAYTRLKRVEENGNRIGPGAGVDKKEVDEALSDSQKAQAALRAAIAKKEEDVENEARNNNMRAVIGAQTDAQVRAKANDPNDIGQETAQRYVRESEQLTRMRDELSKLTDLDTRIGKTLAGELAGKTLNVNVVSDQTGGKPDAGSNGGRDKPPGPKRP